MSEMVGDAIADRFTGERTSAPKAFAVAAVVGFAAAVATYRVLRG